MWLAVVKDGMRHHVIAGRCGDLRLAAGFWYGSME